MPEAGANDQLMLREAGLEQGLQPAVIYLRSASVLPMMQMWSPLLRVVALGRSTDRNQRNKLRCFHDASDCSERALICKIQTPVPTRFLG